MKFIDETQIYVKAGDGGNGCIGFRREKFVPKGGPSGGDGGNGGSVYMVGNRNMTTLLDLRYQRKYICNRGEHGMGSLWHGKSADDILIEVPLGTIISDAENSKFIAEIKEHGKKICIAKGGHGGFGNAHFSTAIIRAPRQATPGKIGEEREIKVELKLIADVGLVGFPNAGKSTLISSISAAKPKIADYPFTTLVPNLGIVQHSAAETFVMADMPGIIEGASEGKGLGLQFLKHIERNEILVFLIPATSDDFLEEYKILRKECKSFSVGLIKKPHLIVISKMDLVQDQKEFDKKWKALTKKENALQISAVVGDGLKPLVHEIWTLLQSVKKEILVEAKKNEPTVEVKEKPWRP